MAKCAVLRWALCGDIQKPLLLEPVMLQTPLPCHRYILETRSESANVLQKPFVDGQLEP